MGKLVKRLELDVLGPIFSRPSPSTYPYSNFQPMFDASFFKISSGLLTSLHQLNYPRITPNSLGLSKTSIPHKSPWPAFQAFLVLPPWHPCPTGSSYRRLTFGPYPKSKRLEWQGPHGVSLIRWLICPPHKQRINHSDLWDWPNCPNDILLSHWCLPSQSCETTRFQTSGYMIPSENFSLVGYKKDSGRKGECWFSLRDSYPLFSL